MKYLNFISVAIFIILFWIIRIPMFLFHLIMSISWLPDVKWPKLGNINPEITSDKFSHDLSGYYKGDGGKFISQAYACIRDEDSWSQVKRFWDWDKNQFFRCDVPKRAWSGDQMAGMALALAVRFREGKLTDEEKKFLSDTCWNAVFGNWIPFRFKHQDTSRGYYWNPFSPGVNCNTQALCLLKLGYLLETSVTKKIIFRVVYWLLLIPSILFYLFGMCDHIIFVRRVCACWWYGTHSDALTYAAGSLLGIPFNKYCLLRLNRRYGKINADISAIAYALCGKDKNKDTVLRLVSDLVKSRDGSTFGFEKRRYYSLRHILKNGGKWFGKFGDIWKESDSKPRDMINHIKTWKIIFDCWQDWNDTWSGGYCCHDRTWERNFLDHGKPYDNDGDLDIIFPLNVINGCLRFDDYFLTERIFSFINRIGNKI